MSNKSITLNELVEKYNSLSNDETKINMVRQYIKRKYCPVIEKQSMLKIMVDKSTVSEANGNKYIDMFVMRMNFVLAIILLYTDIVIENDERKMFDAYDNLINTNIVAIVVDAVGEKEMTELTAIQNAIIETFNNQNDITSYICSFLMHVSTALDLIADRGNEKLQEMINNGSLDNIISKLDTLQGS